MKTTAKHWAEYPETKTITKLWSFRVDLFPAANFAYLRANERSGDKFKVNRKNIAVATHKNLNN